MAVNAGDVLRSLETNAFAIVDARGPDRFAGQNETIDPVGGHIPGAINRPFRSNFAGPLGQMKSPDQLRSEFEAIGIAPQRMVHQCGSGVSAAVNLLAMEHAGLSGARLYPGSWSEWVADPSRPIAAKGPGSSVSS
jgi:thiosulfate/3-mercaptopyruvate sulfurtransferase